MPYMLGARWRLGGLSGRRLGGAARPRRARAGGRRPG
jgi:hypothetical protein